MASDGDRTGSASSGPGNGISLAVLPFSGAAPDEHAFGEALAADVITEFSRFQNLSLAARGPSFACRRFADDTPRVARELGVGYVLEGTVRHTGPEAVRIVVRLLEGATGRVLGTQRLDQAVSDLAGAQEEIAQRITASIAPQLDVATMRRAESLPLHGLSVQDMVLRARSMLLRGAEAEDAAMIEDGLALAREVTEREPRYAEAWRTVAFGHCIRGERGAFGPSTQAEYAAADAAAARLRALEPTSYAAYSIGGHVAMRQGRHGEALESLRHALELNPNAITTLRWLSWEESNHGLAVPAREHAERSLELSPRDHTSYLGHWALALALWVAEDLSPAIEHVRRAVAITPKFGGYYLLLAACLAEQGQLAEAAEAANRVRQNAPGLLESRLSGKTYFTVPALAQRYRAALARAEAAGRTPAAARGAGPVSGADSGPASGPGPGPALAELTGRERDVLRLVARGLSNHAIAESLDISEHTVKRHVANILLKLDLPTRSAASSLAGRHGLI